MGLLVDTSVWSLALRRDPPEPSSEVLELKRALASGDSVYGTGLILQELLQGFAKPRAHAQIVKHFSVLPFLVPERQDHIDAAEIRNKCRRRGVQAGTIDALLTQLCVRHDFQILTTDNDLRHIAQVVPLQVWAP